MKMKLAGFMLLSLILTAGCKSTESPRGGTLPQDKAFTVTVPKRCVIKQGESISVTISLNRDSFFKRNVKLDINTEGIDVTPTDVLIKASEKPEIQAQITVPREAALGEYRVYVNATPSTGRTTSTEFTVEVVVP